MTDGLGNFLNYELYKDSGRSTVFGNSGGGLLSTGAAPNGNARSFTVYERIPGSQDAPVGAYTDVAIVTINF